MSKSKDTGDNVPERWGKDYLLCKEHIVIEDDAHAILDLKKSGQIEYWSHSNYDLVVWNKEENCVFGLLKKIDETYKLSFAVNHLGQHTVQLDEALKVCKKFFDAMLDW